MTGTLAVTAGRGEAGPAARGWAAGAAACLWPLARRASAPAGCAGAAGSDWRAAGTGLEGLYSGRWPTATGFLIPSEYTRGGNIPTVGINGSVSIAVVIAAGQAVMG